MVPLLLTRKRIDLTKTESQKILSKIINYDDTVFFVAAKAPVKNEEMLIQNLKMALNICKVLKDKKIRHLIYLSSDAVYADTSHKLNENSNFQILNIFQKTKVIFKSIPPLSTS